MYSCLRNQAKQFLNVTEYTSVISAEQHCFWTISFYCLLCRNLTHVGGKLVHLQRSEKLSFVGFRYKNYTFFVFSYIVQ